ncbi:MAG: hypothetical protein H0W81_03585 [Chloroflexi bacterium]|nr:hypothetical protein [Chloroflexota bacterium]
MSSYDAAIIDTAMIDHPDLLELPRGVSYLHVEALVWSRLHHTDGEIPRHMPRHFSDEPDVEAAVAALVAAGRWEITPTGWRIVDFLDSQMSAERVAEKRALSRQRWDRFIAGGGQRVSKRASNDSDLTRPDLTRKGRKGGRGADGSRGARPEGATALPPRAGRIPTADTEVLAGIHDGKLCASCTLPFLEGGVHAVKAEASGRFKYFMVHDGGCPMLPESISDDGEYRRGWSICDLCSSMMPEVLVTAPTEGGSRFCLDGDPRGCGGQAAFVPIPAKPSASPGSLVFSDEDDGSTGGGGCLICHKFVDMHEGISGPHGLTHPDCAEQANRELIADPTAPAIVKKAASKALEHMGLEPASASSIPCNNFRDHQSKHRRVGEGWTCDACIPVVAAEAPSHPRPRLVEQASA